MEENNNTKTLKESVGQFIGDHPWMTFFTVSAGIGTLSALIQAPANIIKNLKWDGHYADTHYNYYGNSSEDDSSVEESE